MLKSLRLFQGARADPSVAVAQPSLTSAGSNGRHATPPAPTLNRYLTHQPIVDADYRLIGYSLSLKERVPIPVLPGAVDLEQMKEEMLLVSVIDLAYQQALGNHLTFLSLRPETLHNPLLDLLPPEKVVLAIASNAAADDALIARCAHLAEHGIPLLLDGDPTPETAPLLPYCRYARLDVGNVDVLSLGDRLNGLRAYGAQRIVAGNVSSMETFEACRKLSFSLFHGNYLNQPRQTTERKVDAQRLRVMELLNLVIREAEVPRLAEKLKQDVGLVYRILRYINSPINALLQPVQSIEQALVWLGRDQLYRWLTLLLFNVGPADNRSQTLLQNALVRARFMEKLGTDRFSPPMRGSLFIVGILSQMDALLDMPLPKAIEPLNLAPDITDALLGGKGLFAPYLEMAMACERLDMDTVEKLANEYRLDSNTVNLAHIDSIIWAERLQH